MPSLFGQFQGRASWTLFQALFAIAALISAIVTLTAISSADAADPLGGGMPWLIGLNFVLIGILGGVLTLRYLAMRSGDPSTGGGRLARRYLLLFSLSAVLPATFVAVFLGATISRTVETWFSDRIGVFVEETAEVASDNLEALAETLEEDTRLMALDVGNAAEGLSTDLSLYESFLGAQAAFRGFRIAYVVDGLGERLAMAQLEDPPVFIPPTAEALAEAGQGAVAQTLYETIGVATGLTPLTAPAGAYLYVVQEIDPALLAQMRRAEAALSEYRAARGRSAQLLTFFAVGYAQIAALALLLFARLGLEAAGRITGPIGRLAIAANAVKDGDLGVRVAPPGWDDEVDALTRSFNVMTEQLGEQRAELVAAQEESEDGRTFLETLLAEVSAGVIRTDEALTVTLANRSAEDLLDAGALHGRSLGEAAPEFRSYAVAAMADRLPKDASVDLSRSGRLRHIHLKTSPAPGGGCVITFDDATRLVSAQRQLAWRDVARRIAHEIRNPLTPIQLSVERLRKRYASQMPEEDKVFDRSLDTIMRQVMDIGRMLEEFTNFARMPKPSVAEFDLGAMLERVAFSQGMVTPDIKIVMQGLDQTNPYCGDERLLGQAFTNLMKNAAEAIEAASPTRDVPGEILLRLSGSAAGFRVLVQDNGPGFPADQEQQRFLEPYVTTRDRGSGLGLAIVNRIIIDHGGAVSLQNRSDGLEGASVTVALPHAEPAAQAAILEKTRDRVA